MADLEADRIVVVEPSTNTWTSFECERARSISVDSGGRLFAAGRRLIRFDDLTGSGQTAIIEADPLTPSAVHVSRAIDASDIDVAMSDGTLHRSADGGTTWSVVDLAGAVPAAVSDLCRMDDGTVVFADLANRRVGAVAANGTVSTLIDETLGLGLPSCLTSAGNQLFVADIGFNRIRRYVVTPSEVVAAEFVAGRREDGSYRFDRVTGIAEGELS